MAMATSAPRSNVDFVMHQLDLWDYFHFVIDASMVKKGKPDPEIFIKAAGLLEKQPGECVVFEDSAHGIQAAREAGSKIIAVDTNSYLHQVKVDLLVPNFIGLSVEKVENLFL
jgi:HAD superfamily hydrolase (TIGR01509 family)